MVPLNLFRTLFKTYELLDVLSKLSDFIKILIKHEKYPILMDLGAKKCEKVHFLAFGLKDILCNWREQSKILFFIFDAI